MQNDKICLEVMVLKMQKTNVKAAISQVKRPRSLAEMVADQIRTAIVEGGFSLGQAVSENFLTAKLGISKTPVREALTLLKYEGLVIIVPQKGTFVFTMGVEEMKQLSAYRYTLECAALDYSLANNRDHLLAELRRCQSSMDRSREEGDVNSYLQLDGEFHQALFSYCDNGYLQSGYKSISNKIAALRTHLSQHPTHTEKSHGEHAVFIALLENNDVSRAKEILSKHVSRGERTYADGIQDIATASREQQTLLRKRAR